MLTLLRLNYLKRWPLSTQALMLNEKITFMLCYQTINQASGSPKKTLNKALLSIMLIIDATLLCQIQGRHAKNKLVVGKHGLQGWMLLLQTSNPEARLFIVVLGHKLF